ncbi:MAG: hypothetical protein ACP5U1_14655 [Desulfomonilaceae bacterium]
MSTLMSYGQSSCDSTDCGRLAEAGCECRPKMALTFEEEAILERLRKIKAKVRPISRTLREIEVSQNGKAGAISPDTEAERIRLHNRLSDLRAAWLVWEKKLEDAIERKWIDLGHREPRT